MQAKTTSIKLMSDNGATEWNVEYSHAVRLLRAFGRIYSLPKDSEWMWDGNNLTKKPRKEDKTTKKQTK